MNKPQFIEVEVGEFRSLMDEIRKLRHSNSEKQKRIQWYYNKLKENGFILCDFCGLRSTADRGCPDCGASLTGDCV